MSGAQEVAEIPASLTPKLVFLPLDAVVPKTKLKGGMLSSQMKTSRFPTESKNPREIRRYCIGKVLESIIQSKVYHPLCPVGSEESEKKK